MDSNGSVPSIRAVGARDEELERVPPSRLVDVVKQHKELRLVVLNGCNTLDLGRQLATETMTTVICWETPVDDQAAFYFGVELAHRLSEGGTPREAFDHAKSQLQVIMEPRGDAGPPADAEQEVRRLQGRIVDVRHSALA